MGRRPNYAATRLGLGMFCRRFLPRRWEQATRGIPATALFGGHRVEKSSHRGDKHLDDCSVRAVGVGRIDRRGKPYTCEDGTRLAVRLLGDRAAVSVNDAAEVELPSMGPDGTTFSNGRLTLTIIQGRLMWGVGRAAPSACVGG